MRFWKSILITGIVIFLSGIIFHLQGKSVVGPETSFMYANPQWESYGLQIAVLGAIIIGIGGVLKFIKK